MYRVPENKQNGGAPFIKALVCRATSGQKTNGTFLI